MTAARKTLRALLVTPLSGPLARYGRATATALRLWADAAAALPAPWAGVGLDVRDASPDPAKALRRGLDDTPALVFGPYGSGPARAALHATRRTVWNHGGASSRIAWPEIPGVVNVLAPASSYFTGTLEALRRADPGAQRVTVLHLATGFGADVGEGALAAARGLGFGTRGVRFARGDGGRVCAQLDTEEILLVAGGFEDELAAATIALTRPWRALGFVAAGVDEVLRSMGDAREGLIGPAQWIAEAAPTPDEGPDAPWFAARYRAVAATEPPYPAAQALAAGLVAARCLREAGSADDEALLAGATRLRCRTLYGDFRIDPTTGLQVGHRVLTVQWQSGARRVIWPPPVAERALVHPR